MQKTPDDIKKGLEHCNRTFDACHKCPYDTVDEGWGCTVEKNADALALIEQLEAENKQYHQENTEMYAEMCMLREKVHRLEAERDAAVESMRKDPHCCFHCKHKGKWPSCNSDPRPNGSCFEWRGVQKEE